MKALSTRTSTFADPQGAYYALVDIREFGYEDDYLAEQRIADVIRKMTNEHLDKQPELLFRRLEDGTHTVDIPFRCGKF